VCISHGSVCGVLIPGITFVLLVLGVFGQAVESNKQSAPASQAAGGSQSAPEEKALPAWTLKDALKSKSPAQNAPPVQIRNSVNFSVVPSPKSCSIPLTRIEPRERNSAIQKIAPVQVDPQSVMRPPVPTCDEKVFVNPDLVREIHFILDGYEQK